jgi:protein-L-isoaspartate(D-aspartate) O-methyltransferase
MPPRDWAQATIEFTDWPTAEQAAVEHLRPALQTAETAGVIGGWWFIRKAPCWRLRYQPTADHDADDLPQLLDQLAAEDAIAGWTASIYEPETVAFGGAAAMDIAHDLFCLDSRAVLDHLTRSAPADRTANGGGLPGLGRRELAILLPSVLMRAAGQDWYEQGDVWAKVAQHRPTPPTPPAPFSDHIRWAAAARRLMSIDASPTSPLVDGGPLTAVAEWLAGFDHAGRHLADLAARGQLERGLRAVLTHHVIFSWNRLGLSYAQQHTLSHLAKEVVMTDPAAPVSTPPIDPGGTTVAVVNAHPTAAAPTAADAEPLRATLVDRLRDQGTVRTRQVEEALRGVPRHVFLPGVPVEQAYADDPVYTKHDRSAGSISAASQPTIVAMMLEQLQVQPGQRIFEIGAGTGFNAALLAHLAGEHGHVTTVDVDDDIVTGARTGLAAAGVTNAEVILGDGALGYPPAAPYDRIIAAVGAWGVPPAWLDQLAAGGRVVVPTRLRGSVSRSIAFEHHDGRWRSRDSQMCTFMPLRGIADDPRRTIPLSPGATVTLQTHQDQDADAATLAGVLDQPANQVWTGVLFRGPESFEWLDLWLTCALPNALSRMPTQQSAIDAGLVKPQFGWGAMATAEHGSIAYLTLRPTQPAGDLGRGYEVGVIGHGPAAGELAGRVAEHIRTWDRDYRGRSVEFEILTTEATQPADGQVVIPTPHDRLLVTWH